MMSRFRMFTRAVAVTAMLVSVACGSSSSITGPSSAGSTGTGAVITGQINGLGSAAFAMVPSSGFTALKSATITITVAGTSISTTSDSSGHFTLTNVPGGTIQLQFSGSGVSATVTINGVSTSDQIDIVVTVTGNSAHVDSDHRLPRQGNGVQVNGRIASRDLAARTFVVNGTTVSVPLSATIRHGSRTFVFADLAIGDHVQVKGTWNANVLVATEVKVEDEGEDD